jgi:hypothetical protein
LSHNPIVRQLLGPEWIDLVLRSRLRQQLWDRAELKKAEKE